MSQEESEQNEVELDRMKKGADSTGKVMHVRPKATRVQPVRRHDRTKTEVDFAVRSHSIACNAR